MEDDFMNRLEVGDKVLVDDITRVVERITPSKQIKVSGIERKFINGRLKGAMMWDGDTYLREWSQEREDQIKDRRIRAARIQKISKASFEIFTDAQLYMLCDEIDPQISEVTDIKKGDIVTFDGRRRHHDDVPISGCKVISNPFIEGKSILVHLDKVSGSVYIQTVKKE